MYPHVFFDLDHTLWDFEKNSRESLVEIFDSFIKPHHPDFDCAQFIIAYEKTNEKLWEAYGLGKMTKTELRYLRFANTLQALGLEAGAEIDKIDAYYVENTPRKKHLFPGALQTLGQLLEMGFRLHLITNGFNETQKVKIKNSGLNDFFETVTTAENAGFWKPDVRIFYSAMSKPKARPGTSCMIGDHLDRDVRGANRAGMGSVWFNPKKKENLSSVKPHFEISELPALLDIIQK